MVRALSDLESRPAGHSVGDNLMGPLGEPRPLLVWALVQESSGPGHEWVLDGGFRLDRRGDARKGNLQLQDDAPMPAMAWVTAVRFRLILPLRRILQIAQLQAGVSGEECPPCGCSHCRGRATPAVVDGYGMHLSASVAYYTRRHHQLASLFERFARQAGLLALHENKSFGASLALSAEDRGKQVDTRLDGLEFGVVEFILPSAARHALGDRAESRLGPEELQRVPVDLLLDYTFHHPGAYLSKVPNLRARLPDLADAMAEVAERTKDDKYRRCATQCSAERPHRPAMAFAALVLSVCGRQHPTTRRAMRYVARLRAVRSVCVSDMDWRHPDFGMGPDVHELKLQVGRRTHTAMMAFSSLAMAALVDGLEEGARQAARAPKAGPCPPPASPHAQARAGGGGAGTAARGHGAAQPPVARSQPSGPGAAPRAVQRDVVREAVVVPGTGAPAPAAAVWDAPPRVAGEGLLQAGSVVGVAPQVGGCIGSGSLSSVVVSATGIAPPGS